MIPEWVSQLGNHLWQSTLCAAVAGLLSLLLRKNQAQTRYWLWLSASLKFLIPFSLLINLGRHLDLSPWTQATFSPAQSRLPIVIGNVFTPAVSGIVTQAAAPSQPSALPVLLVTAWGCGLGAVLFSWWRQWRRIHKARRAARPLPFRIQIQVLSSSRLMEPGVFGILRPVLMLPEGIAERLTPAQLETIIAHELCHVRRRDNLAAAVQMVVEAVIWFYPLVWWLGRRMVEERERACDEEVLRLGSEPEIYAEGILKVCEFYLESPLTCSAGVTGANLRRRIAAIMADDKAKELDLGRKLLVATTGIAITLAPIIIGVLGSPQIRARSEPTTPLAFEVASVKPNKSYSLRFAGIQFLSERFQAGNVDLETIISTAYNLPQHSSQLIGGPSWIRFERYDIEGIAEKGAIQMGASANVRDEKLRLMLQTLLADRFKLEIRREMKAQPVYALVVGKNGPKLQRAAIDEKDCVEEPTNDSIPCHLFTGGQGRGIHGQAVSMADVVQHVANWTDRAVIDKTGIHGLFNIQTDGWVPLRPRFQIPGAEPSKEDAALGDPTRPTLFMIFERLGLKLESQREPIETLVIEHVDRPSEN